MTTSAPRFADPQLSLAFDAAEGPQPESALRCQYLRMQISRRMSFAQAMSDRAIAICIRHLAAADARGRRDDAT